MKRAAGSAKGFSEERVARVPSGGHPLGAPGTHSGRQLETVVPLELQVLVSLRWDRESFTWESLLGDSPPWAPLSSAELTKYAQHL